MYREDEEIEALDLRIEEVIEGTPLRVVFADLVASALEEAEICLSPFVRSYLVQLLEGQVCTCSGELVSQFPGRFDGSDPGIPELAEAFMSARIEEGLERVPRLRALGDRALFVAGFFRGSLAKRGAERELYADIGRQAYEDISGCLATHPIEPGWARLFWELADRYDEIEDLLAEVGDYSRPDPSTELLKMYDRYARTGSLRDRAGLVKYGLAPPPRSGMRTC